MKLFYTHLKAGSEIRGQCGEFTTTDTLGDTELNLEHSVTSNQEGARITQKDSWAEGPEMRQSNAYRWLLSRLHQDTTLNREAANAMLEIESMIWKGFLNQPFLDKSDHKRSFPVTTMEFKMRWNPVRDLLANGIDPTTPGVLGKIHCITGTEKESQVMSVTDYLSQTWPENHEPVLQLLYELLTHSEGVRCECKK